MTNHFHQTSQLSLFHSKTQSFCSILKVSLLIPSNLTVKRVYFRERQLIHAFFLNANMLCTPKSCILAQSHTHLTVGQANLTVKRGYSRSEQCSKVERSAQNCSYSLCYVLNDCSLISVWLDCSIYFQSSLGSSADRISPAMQMSEDSLKVMEAERKVSELQAQLSSVEKER